MFECLVGYPPFGSENAYDTYRKIINWKNQLFFPDDVWLGREAEDVTRRMITSADQRLGRNSGDEIKNYPFFAGVDWNTMRNIESPFIPQLRSLTDTSYFPTEDLNESPSSPRGPTRGRAAAGSLPSSATPFRRYKGAVSHTPW